MPQLHYLFSCFINNDPFSVKFYSPETFPEVPNFIVLNWNNFFPCFVNKAPFII